MVSIPALKEECEGALRCFQWRCRRHTCLTAITFGAAIKSQLISGIKRDIALLQQVPSEQASSVTVLDISMDKNQAALEGLLDHHVPTTYIDHHKASSIPNSQYLDAHIDLDANTCTALIVDKLLQGQFRLWAVAAAYGDNMLASAEALASTLGLSDEQRRLLNELGTLINYNATVKARRPAF